MLIGCDVERAIAIPELKQVQGSEVACGVVEEHIFRARIGRTDRAGSRAGVPIIHRRVEMQARISRRPRGVTDLLPQIARLQGLVDLAIGALDQVPVGVAFDRTKELVFQRNRVVGVLASNREIGFRIPIGIIDGEIDFLVALLGELDDALDVVVRHRNAAGELDLAL